MQSRGLVGVLTFHDNLGKPSTLFKILPPKFLYISYFKLQLQSRFSIGPFWWRWLFMVFQLLFLQQKIEAYSVLHLPSNQVRIFLILLISVLYYQRTLLRATNFGMFYFKLQVLIKFFDFCSPIYPLDSSGFGSDLAMDEDESY